MSLRKRRRRLRRKIQSQRRKERYANVIAKRSSPLFFSSPHFIRRKSSEIIGDDKRRFKPPTDRETKQRDGRRVSFTLSDGRNARYLRQGTKAKITFHNSKHVTTCVRRKSRRIALFSSGRIGKGIRVNPIRRRNEDSDIKCRR